MEFSWINDNSQKPLIVKEVLETLSKWFGIKSAIEDYVKESKKYPLLNVLHNNQTIGFLSLKPTSNYALEVYVMGLKQEYHRQGIGKTMIEHAIKYANNHNYTFITVKTLDAFRENEEYAKTRLFYESVGFIPIETFKTLWDENNPCLFLILPLKNTV